ncbi:unnamed protein product [Pleuronectes platessa]|uniref:Uncharacterized protein n=1 Tax=Pleuronectes platessa TaxID=8262 RepID=A0A9N7YBV7_PLEPL|nr:unnamed protein product [Pleuronectes platessa]
MLEAPYQPAISVFPGAIRSRQAEKIDSTPKRSLHGARQPWRSATLQPPASLRRRFGVALASLCHRFGVASASGSGGGDNKLSERQLPHKLRQVSSKTKGHFKSE